MNIPFPSYDPGHLPGKSPRWSHKKLLSQKKCKLWKSIDKDFMHLTKEFRNFIALFRKTENYF
jgi:hypothetical protein